MIVACPSGGDLPRWVRDAGALHAVWPASRSPGPATLVETQWLRGILGRVDPDIVHLHSSKAGLAGRLALRGRRPTVFQPHAWSWLAASGTARAAARRWEQAAARWTDLILCVSESERLEGERAGLRGRWEVVPNGVDLGKFRAASKDDRVRARALLGLDERPLVVCVGRLSRQKGQDVLLEAWPCVLQQVPSARLVLVGDGPDRAALERRQVVGVEFVGQRADVPVWLAAADVVAMPSRWEGMSLVMLEAMATGRCIVATEVAGGTETLASSSGALVPPEDPRRLCAAIGARLIDSELRGAEESAVRAFVERERDLQAALDAVAQLYLEVLESRRA